jgi:hypothetical protein
LSSDCKITNAQLLINLNVSFYCSTEDNFAEVARLFEAAGDYDDAAKHYVSMGDFLKAATCKLRTARLKILDDSFLPAQRLQDESGLAEAIKQYSDLDSQQATNCSSVESAWNDIHLELELLQSGGKITLENYVEKWSAKLVSSPACIRFSVIAIRCALRDIRQRRDASLLKGNNVNSSEHAGSCAWKPLRSIVHELDAHVAKLRAALYQHLPRFIEGRSLPSDQMSVLLQLLELFEIR